MEKHANVPSEMAGIANLAPSNKRKVKRGPVYGRPYKRKEYYFPVSLQRALLTKVYAIANTGYVTKDHLKAYNQVRDLIRQANFLHDLANRSQDGELATLYNQRAIKTFNTATNGYNAELMAKVKARIQAICRPQ